MSEEIGKNGNAPTKLGTRQHTIMQMFPPPSEEELDLITSTPPSGRPVQMSIYPWKSSGLLEARDLVYLEPKRTMTSMMDQVLASANPIYAARELNFDNSVDSLHSLVLSLNDHALQPRLFDAGERLDRVNKVRNLLRHEKENIRAKMLEVFNCYSTFINWLKEPGYDFVFGPLKVPDCTIDVDGKPGKITGGAIDSLGVKLMKGANHESVINKFSVLNGRHSNSRWSRNLQTLVTGIRKIAAEERVEISGIEILEFKLGAKESYEGRRHQMNLEQVTRYLGSANTLLGIGSDISSKLIYFGQDTPEEIYIKPVAGIDWAIEAIRRSILISRIKAGAQREEKAFRSLLEGVQQRDLSYCLSLIEGIIEHEFLTLNTFSAMTHYAGARHLQGDSISFDFGVVTATTVKNENSISIKFSAKEKLDDNDIPIGNELIGRTFPLVNNTLEQLSPEMITVLASLKLFGRKI